MHFGLFWIICIMRSISLCLFFHPDVFLIFGSELLTPGTQLLTIIPLAQKNLCAGGGGCFGWLFPIAAWRALALCQSTCYLLCSCFSPAPTDGSAVPLQLGFAFPRWRCENYFSVIPLYLSFHCWPIATRSDLKFGGARNFFFLKALYN